MARGLRPLTICKGTTSRTGRHRSPATEETTLKLCLRPIESDLPATPEEVPSDERDLWRDSSLDLERGLDVIELPVEVPFDEVQAPP